MRCSFRRGPSRSPRMCLLRQGRPLCDSGPYTSRLARGPQAPVACPARARACAAARGRRLPAPGCRAGSHSCTLAPMWPPPSFVSTAARKLARGFRALMPREPPAPWSSGSRRCTWQPRLPRRSRERPCSPLGQEILLAPSLFRGPTLSQFFAPALATRAASEAALHRCRRPPPPLLLPLPLLQPRARPVVQRRPLRTSQQAPLVSCGGPGGRCPLRPSASPRGHSRRRLVPRGERSRRRPVGAACGRQSSSTGRKAGPRGREELAAQRSAGRRASDRTTAPCRAVQWATTRPWGWALGRRGSTPTRRTRHPSQLGDLGATAQPP